MAQKPTTLLPVQSAGAALSRLMSLVDYASKTNEAVRKKDTKEIIANGSVCAALSEEIQIIYHHGIQYDNEYGVKLEKHIKRITDLIMDEKDRNRAHIGAVIAISEEIGSMSKLVHDVLKRAQKPDDDINYFPNTSSGAPSGVIH